MRFFPIPGDLRVVLWWAALGMFASGLVSCVPESDLSTDIDGGAAYGEKGKSGSLPDPGDWWKDFRDPGLEALIERLRVDNPGLKAALARYDQARSALGVVKADQVPSINGEGAALRRRDSAGGIFVPPDLTYNDYRAGLNLEYEVDLWGRVRKSVDAARAELEASSADLEAARLSLETELARNWYQLRFLNEEIRVLDSSVKLREENVVIIDARVRGGETTQLDLERARTEVETARAQKLQVERSRAQREHAIAILVGEAPSRFELPDEASKVGVGKPATIPPGVPSQLLERRPDIASAEQRLVAAAAKVGVVKTSILPQLTLSGTGGLSTLDSSNFFDPISFFGEIGPGVQFPVFEGGRAFSEISRSEAQAREALETYREIVLNSFREVEDALSDIHFLDREIVAHEKAAAAAEEASRLSRKRYGGGLVSYLEVVDAERTALAEQRELTQTKSARHLASVQLVQALGGGWGKTGD